MKIKAGHLVRVFEKNDTWEGVVVRIFEHCGYSILPVVRIDIYDAVNRIAHKVYTTKDFYETDKFKIIFLREVEEDHTYRLFKKFELFVGAPEKIEPNKNYDNGIEVFVRTKKKWFNLIRTTAKMAFYDGGRCIISNITRVRRT